MPRFPGLRVRFQANSYVSDFASDPSPCAFAAKRVAFRIFRIQASGGAFAAILQDGSVVTWGDPDKGGKGHLQTA